MAPPTPPSPTRHLATTPDRSPSDGPLSGDPGVPARTGRSLRRVVLWSFVAAVVLVGIYFYFAYARSVTPLRVGS